MAFEIDLTGKRAVVSGVTSGIGLGIARSLAGAGCSIAGCGSRDPDSEGAQTFLSIVRAKGVDAHYFQADLSTSEGPVLFGKRAIEALGGVDILVSNAGRNIFKGAADCNEADWNACMQLDLASHWRLAQTVYPSLKENHGTILIIGSNHSRATIPGCFPYNVAKAGLAAMVQSLAIEWGPEVRCVGIEPGFIDTAGNETWFDSFPDPEKERQRTEALHPVGRIGTVEEIGSLAVFLASKDAGFISGTNVLVDGGRNALMQDNLI